MSPDTLSSLSIITQDCSQQYIMPQQRQLCSSQHSKLCVGINITVYVLTIIYHLLMFTPSSPVSNGYTSECSGPQWSNPPFLTFLTIGHSGAQDWSPECPNVKELKGELDQYGPECFGRLIFATIRKSVGLKQVNAVDSLQKYCMVACISDTWLLIQT